MRLVRRVSVFHETQVVLELFDFVLTEGSSATIRCISMMRFRMPAIGLLISCTTEADSLPKEDILSWCRSFSWVSFT